MPLGFRLAGAVPAPRCPSAVNDNPPSLQGPDFGSRILLRDALRHFAAYGPGAVEVAQRNAELAFFAGDRPDYLHWLAICRALDRRMVGTGEAAAHWSR